jgi:hypothetical protein
MLRIAKTLPGELEGKINPEDYGFDVIREEPPDEEETARRIERLYRQVQERTGMVIPAIERYLDETGTAEEPGHEAPIESPN